MTLSDFVEAERMRAIKFYEWYIGQHRTLPSTYPLSLPLYEWDDQMEIFKEGNL